MALKFLYLQNNSIENIEALSFINSLKLKKLSLFKNNIVYIKSLIKNPLKLECLEMSDNLIINIDEIFRYKNHEENMELKINNLQRSNAIFKFNKTNKKEIGGSYKLLNASILKKSIHSESITLS